MEAASFGTLANITSLGLLADKMVLALERVDRVPGARIAKQVLADYGSVLNRAKQFLRMALDVNARADLARRISRRAVQSGEAYHQAERAVRVSVQVNGRADNEDAHVPECLQRVMKAVEDMSEGNLTNEQEREQVKEFFKALSDVAAAEHDKMSLQPPVRWMGDI